MKIAAALGVCHFLVYKTTTPECWRRRLSMILAKKRPFPGKGHARMTLWVQRLHINYKIASAFTPERGCTTELHQKYIKITSLLRQIAGVQQNYIKSTSLLHHFYVRSDLWTIRTSAPLPGPPARAENGFSGCAGNASRPRNKLRPRSPFSGKKNIGNRTYPGWMAWISALCICAHTHACRKNRACAFLAGFRVVCCLFYRFPVRNALRQSEQCA